MTDAREWFSAEARRRVTATEMAQHLGVARNTVNGRLQEGLSADDIITLARAIKVSPINALVELEKVTYDEVFSFLERGGKLVETASEGELALVLAERLNPRMTIRPATGGDNVHELTLRNQHQSIDRAPSGDDIDDLELPYVAHEPDEELDEDDDESKYDV